MLNVQFATDRTGADEPTYTVDVSPIRSLDALAGTLAGAGVNCTLSATIGTWEGSVEHGARVTVQGSDVILNTVLDVLYGEPGVRWVHVFELYGRATYVDLDNYSLPAVEHPADRLKAVADRARWVPAERAHRSIGGGPCLH